VNLSDATTSAVEFALRGVAQRASVHADNIANASTPGFISRRVDFESALADALERDQLDVLVDPPVANAMGIPDANGNTVSLETEMVGLIKNNLVQDAMVNAFNFKLNTMRTAIGRR
jgi:flagellar basal-body rod protein FlgB